MLGSPTVAEAVALSGVDYVGIDCQHGLVGLDGMVSMLMALARTPAAAVVRTPPGDHFWIGKALDAGAEAVVVPMVNTEADAAAAAAACRYPPTGNRSNGRPRAGALTATDPAVMNAEVVCLVMIETLEAVANLDAIVSVPGVDGVYIGPSDLALSMGLPPSLDVTQPERRAVVEQIRDACLAQGKIPAIHTSGGEGARSWAEAGFRMMSLASEGALLGATYRQHLATARSGPASPAPAAGSTPGY